MKEITITLIMFSLGFIGCTTQETQTENKNIAFVNLAGREEVIIEEEIEIKDVLLEVPFTSQAPYANWNDSRFQDGCEEASMLRAAKWVGGDMILTRDEANQAMLDMAVWQQENYGSAVDTSAQDTADRILKGYFGVENYEVKENIVLDDIKLALAQGYLAIMPMDGQLLGNPNYTAPGPERHMLVVIGYDLANKQFITNDSGTRMGEGYRYDENIVYDAIRDYPTGDHVPITQIKKTMIVVKK